MANWKRWTTSLITALFLILSAARGLQAAELSLHAGPSVFDFASTGVTFSTAVRLSQPLGEWVRVEAAAAFAFPKQRDDSRVTLFQPEAGLLLQWPRSDWTPYIGAAAGVGGFDAFDDPDWEVSVSGGVGAFIPIGERATLRPDVRIRGFGEGLSASITDISIGLAFSL